MLYNLDMSINRLTEYSVDYWAVFEGSLEKLATLLLVCIFLARNTQVAMAFPPVEAPAVVKFNYFVVFSCLYYLVVTVAF